MKPQRVGVIPWLLHDGALLVVLVRSRDGARWVLPKGRVEKRRSRRAVAAAEAWEEAGLRGTMTPRAPIDVLVRQQGRLLLMRLYPLRVDEIADRWPERRERRIVPAEEAAELLGKGGFRQAVRRMGRWRAPDTPAPEAAAGSAP